MDAKAGYLTVRSLADYLDYRGTDRGKQSAARHWVERTGCPKYWRGRAWVVKASDVDRILAGETVVA